MRNEYSSKPGLQRELNGRYGTHVPMNVLFKTQSEESKLRAHCTVEKQVVKFLLKNPNLLKEPNWKIMGQRNSPSGAPSRDN